MRISLLFLLAVGSAPVGLSATRALTLTGGGDVTGVLPLVRQGDTVQVELITKDCSTLALTYFSSDTVRQPDIPPEGENWISAPFSKPSATSTSCFATIPPKATGGRMLLYAVSAIGKVTGDQVDKAEKEIKALEAEIKKKNDEMEPLTKEVSVLIDEIKQFQGVSTAQTVDEIKLRQDKIRPLNKNIDIIKKSIKDLEDPLKEAKKRLEELKGGQSRYLRLGGFLLAGNSKIVNYRIARGGAPNLPIRLERLGDYPEIIQNDDLYAVIVNRRNPEDPERFELTFNVTAGAAPNLAPVRPSFNQVSGESQSFGTQGTHYDVILPFGQRFRGNDVLKVTIQSYLKEYEASNKTTSGKDGSTKIEKTEIVKQAGPVKLLDAAEYPQVHALYHFNVSTGIVASFLRDSTFQKVKTKAAIPATSSMSNDGKPAEYEVVEDRGQPRAMPALFFTAYVLPFDLHRKWSPRELIPMPTVGFALTSPDQNFFFGGSMEVLRNVQLVFGYHHGRVTVRGGIPVDERTTEVAPQTRKEFRGSSFVGASFNLTFLKTLFGK